MEGVVRGIRPGSPNVAELERREREQKEKLAAEEEQSKLSPTTKRLIAKHLKSDSDKKKKTTEAPIVTGKVKMNRGTKIHGIGLLKEIILKNLKFQLFKSHRLTPLSRQGWRKISHKSLLYCKSM